ncbi:MAG: hypothetical protein GY941_08130 [Planctomycetes bacterium]|nr:hypothetical protein [Planctomycetota bacterium]
MSKYLLNKITTLIFITLGFACVINIETSIAEISVELLPHWRKGERQSLELVKTRQRIKGNKLVLDSTTRTDFNIEIIEADNKGYLLSWTHGETTFDNPEQANNPIVEQMSNILKGLQIIFEIDSRGYITGVPNWKEMKKKSDKVISAIRQSLNETGADKTTVDKVCDQIASMFSTKKQIEMMSTREAGLYFLALGRNYTLSSPFVYDDVLANPFGGEPFPSKAKLLMESHDREKDRSIVKWNQTIPTEDATRILKKTFQDLADRFGKPMPKEDELPKFDIKDSAEFTVRASSGWIEKLKHIRTTKVNTDWQQDTMVIRMKGVK